jgi:hypothetical protein
MTSILKLTLTSLPTIAGVGSESRFIRLGTPHLQTMMLLKCARVTGEVTYENMDTFAGQQSQSRQEEPPIRSPCSRGQRLPLGQSLISDLICRLSCLRAMFAVESDGHSSTPHVDGRDLATPDLGSETARFFGSWKPSFIGYNKVGQFPCYCANKAIRSFSHHSLDRRKQFWKRRPF